MTRPAIPLPVARQLRQEAGFGCCICGLPIIRYHHIVEWATEHHFRPEDMMVLCPLHHEQATAGALTEPEQRRHKADPYNIRAGLAGGQIMIEDRLVVVVGTNQFADDAFLKVNGEVLVRARRGPDGELLLDLKLYDEADSLIAQIEANEWLAGDPFPWDLQASFQTLRIREAARKISLDIDARTPPTVDLRAQLWRDGVRVAAEADGLFIGGAAPGTGWMSYCRFESCGIRINTEPSSVLVGARITD